MNIVKKSLIALLKIYLFLFGIYHFMFVSDKLLMYADLNPLHYQIETLEQLNEEGWVVPLGFQMVESSVFIIVAFIGFFQFNRYHKWFLMICVLGILLWLIGFYWLGNVFRMLNAFQIKLYFIWDFFNFLAPAFVILRQLYLKRQIEQNIR